MATTTIEPADIAIELGIDPASLDTVSTAQYQRWIDDAIRLINKRLGDLAPDLEDVDYVVRQAVVAVAQIPNPGVQSESVQIDDGMVTTRYNRGARRVQILPEWWSMLGVAEGGQAFTIDMSSGSDAYHQPWCDVYLGGTSCSCGAALAGVPLWEY